jgi:hypothetical protein
MMAGRLHSAANGSKEVERMRKSILALAIPLIGFLPGGGAATPVSANGGAVCVPQAFGAQTSAPLGTIAITFGGVAYCVGINGTLTATLRSESGATLATAGPANANGPILVKGSYSISSIEPMHHVYTVVATVTWIGESLSSTVPVAGAEFNCACTAG